MAVALWYLDPGQLGGPIQRSADNSGFTWTVVAVYADSPSARGDVVSGIQAQTLYGDTLVQVRDKINAAVKARGLVSSPAFDVSVEVFPQFATVAV